MNVKGSGLSSGKAVQTGLGAEQVSYVGGAYPMTIFISRIRNSFTPPIVNQLMNKSQMRLSQGIS
jgi:hypothetical protein